MIRLPMSDADVWMTRGWLSLSESDSVRAALLTEAAWKQDRIVIQGQSIALPRLTAWHGTHGYRYSGIENRPQPWTPSLLSLQGRLEALLQARFNSVLCNHYRDGRDSVSWHADDERELGPTPTIASVSLGAARKFSFRRRDRTGQRVDLLLEDGDLLVMRGATQQYWLHQVPKTTREVGARINLTFREVLVP